MPFIHVTMIEGRTLETKQAIMQGIVEAVEKVMAPTKVRVWITEVPAGEVSVGGVPVDESRAQRLREAPENEEVPSEALA
jgi:4-oxalocrotonate tautomerase family enzyme